MSLPRSNPLRSLVVLWHRVSGVTLFQCARYERSRRHFERILEHHGDDFGAYVHLGRIAYTMGDYSGWRRECEHAQRTSPERYARLKHPFELFAPRAAGTLHEETEQRATWQAMEGETLCGTFEDPVERSHGSSRVGIPRRRFGDDFNSAAEREKFRSLIPIQSDEIDRTDLDDLTRQLGA